MRYPVTDAVHNWALKQCTEQAFNATTILKGGTGQYVGYIGEATFGQWLNEHGLPFDYIAQDSFHADFAVLGLSFDVKSKNRSVLPKRDYAAHVAASQRNQQCGYYVFASILMVRDRAACCDLMGFISKDQFWSTCEQPAVGETYGNGMQERTEAGKVPYISLRSMDDLSKNLKIFLRSRSLE